jgi:tetratricopeptide (TPR) repeat protein
MELKIIPHPKNNYPLKGILIRGSAVSIWLKELQTLDLSPQDIQVFPVPSLSPNVIWGCVILLRNNPEKIEVGRHEYCQGVTNNLYIAERSEIFPVLTDSELKNLFSKGKHLIHPEFGIVELSEEVNFLELLSPLVSNPITVTRPEASISLPSQVRSFQVRPLPPEEVLDNLTEKVFPKHEKLKDKKLSPFEKVKLGVYRMLFKKDGTTPEGQATQDTKFTSWLKSFFTSEAQWDKIQVDFEDLEKRNQKEIDKLMNLLKNDPKEALKYAIPLDSDNTTRGGMDTRGHYTLSKRWFDFSLFGENSSGGSGTINLGDHFNLLQAQYNATADEFLKKKEYKQAAFVFMKLLKQFNRAAEAMELGHHYQEAATIHLKHTGNEAKAAECYEKGNMLMEAIALYKKRNDDEKAGDLFMRLGNKPAAMEHYQNVVNQFKSKNQYVKASIVCRNKMSNAAAAQSMLLEGWKDNHDAVNCLNVYFSIFSDDQQLRQAIDHIYLNDVDHSNKELFLKVMHHEYQRKASLRESLREMAFEIVADRITRNPAIVGELKNFNPDNKELIKDTVRYKLNKNK